MSFDLAKYESYEPLVKDGRMVRGSFDKESEEFYKKCDRKAIGHQSSGAVSFWWLSSYNEEGQPPLIWSHNRDHALLFDSDQEASDFIDRHIPDAVMAMVVDYDYS